MISNFKAAARRLRQEPYSSAFSLIEAARVAPFPWLDLVRLWVLGFLIVAGIAGASLLVIEYRLEKWVGPVLLGALIGLYGVFMLLQLLVGKKRADMMITRAMDDIERITGFRL
ncbi:MAG TPA: hypothetical protein VFY29_02340 [Terriglobia bacterium]|nr:hypothetical protein [Terriglobia bacterium]